MRFAGRVSSEAVAVCGLAVSGPSGEGMFPKDERVCDAGTAEAGTGGGSMFDKTFIGLAFETV